MGDSSALTMGNRKKKQSQEKPSSTSVSEEPPEQLEGAVVVVTGSSSGIGEAIALECARRGARLVLTARREAELRRVAVACKSAGAWDVAVVPGDGQHEETAERVKAAAVGFGGVDRLYINAGISQNTRLLDAPVSVVREQLEINFFSGVLLTYACLPSILERRGRIVAVTSGQGRLPAPRNTGYSASKHAMHGFFESLRQEVEPQGVSVTMVLPGPVDTGILSNLVGPGGSTVGFVFSSCASSYLGYRCLAQLPRGPSSRGLLQHIIVHGFLDVQEPLHLFADERGPSHF